MVSSLQAGERCTVSTSVMDTDESLFACGCPFVSHARQVLFVGLCRVRTYALPRPSMCHVDRIQGSKTFLVVCSFTAPPDHKLALHA